MQMSAAGQVKPVAVRARPLINRPTVAPLSLSLRLALGRRHWPLARRALATLIIRRSPLAARRSCKPRASVGRAGETSGRLSGGGGRLTLGLFQFGRPIPMLAPHQLGLPLAAKRASSPSSSSNSSLAQGASSKLFASKLSLARARRRPSGSLCKEAAAAAAAEQRGAAARIIRPQHSWHSFFLLRREFIIALGPFETGGRQTRASMIGRPVGSPVSRGRRASETRSAPANNEPQVLAAA